MANRVSFSYEELTLADISAYFENVQAGLFGLFSKQSIAPHQHYSQNIYDEVLEKSLTELDVSSSFLVLSSLEATIRLDYLRRVYDRRRDSLSRAMRLLHRRKENHARLEGDLIRLWRQETDMSKALLGELAGAFRYRHWLAHGRYWKPKLGRKYDYLSVFGLAQEFDDALLAYC